MRHSTLRLSMIPALACCLLASGAMAAEMTDAEKDALRSSCRSDYFSYCSSVPRGPAVLTCLQKNIASVSAGCRQALSNLGGASTPPAAAAKTAPAASTRRQTAPPPETSSPPPTHATTPSAAPARGRACCSRQAGSGTGSCGGGRSSRRRQRHHRQRRPRPPLQPPRRQRRLLRRRPHRRHRPRRWHRRPYGRWRGSCSCAAPAAVTRARFVPGCRSAAAVSWSVSQRRCRRCRRRAGTPSSSSAVRAARHKWRCKA